MSTKRNTSPFQFAPIPGSQKLAPRDCDVVKDELHGCKRVKFSIQAPMVASEAAVQKLLDEVASGARAPLSVAELEAVTGADVAHIEQIVEAVKVAGLTVLPRTDADISHGIVRVSGTYAAARKFLPGLKLSHNRDKKGRMFFARAGEINARADLPIEGIFGLDTRRVAKTRYRLLEPTLQPRAGRTNHGTARDIARAQGFPVEEMDKTPVVGGYISLDGDNGEKMQGGLKIAAGKAGIAVTKIVGVPVNGATIDGDPDDGATVENKLDMQDQALLNPNGVCVVFRAPNDDDSFAQCLEAAVAFKGAEVNGVLQPLMGVSISWGMAEVHNTQQSLRRWERTLKAARLRGMFVTAATGDDGSKDKTRAATPDAPSCVAGMIGAAGVELIFDSTGKKVTGEKVWNDMPFGGATGGGVSAVFPVTPEELSLGLDPSVFISKSTKKPGHISSTIADNAAPATGPLIYNEDGTASTVGGTSSAAPTIFIKLCMIQAALPKPLPDMLGFVYRNARNGIFNQVTEPGDNGDYSVQPSDLLGVPTGFGVINWPKFLELARKEAAGSSTR
ncbi:MAG: hypothetical protein EKK48_26140 [Candidatus Melainabacteria bacterium]|nr:MAG: hypothetical protein EKK48_26140 [Candidatus Melainabacteria bacterium]